MPSAFVIAWKGQREKTSSVLAETKLILPPLIGVGIVVGNILNSLPEGLRVVLDLAALAILFAGFLVLGRLRAQASAAEGAAQAWREERDASVSKNERLMVENKQLHDEITELRVIVSKLESRPTLESLEEEVRKLASLISATQSSVSPITEGGT